MHGLAERINSLAPVIGDILKVSGAAGASIGIYHNGETFTTGYGYRDVGNKLTPDEHTFYHLASLSKSFTAAGIGALVHEGKLAWDQTISSILNNFSHPDPVVQKESTILDCLCHRTGLATKNALWQQDGPELLLGHMDLIPTISYLEVIAPFRSKWIYNNWNYDIAAEIIETVTGKPWADFLLETIIQPLELEDTFTSLSPPTENWAIGYMPAPTCELTDVGRPTVSNGTIMQGANGVKSSVADLLRYYKAVLDAWRNETLDPYPSSLPLKGISELLNPHIALDENGTGQWYGAGWVIADLPSPLGSIGTNGMFLSEMPLVAKGTKRTRVWYHNGSLVGFFSSVHIIPETDTIIVVLTNPITKNDCADWLGQLLIEELLDVEDKNDYTRLATETAAAYDRMWTELEKGFEKSVPNDIQPAELSRYVGRYYNRAGNWFISVFEAEGSLHFSFQGRPSQLHRLKPYGNSTFIWPLTEVESRNLARWPDLDKETYTFNFESSENQKIDTLIWVHDPDVPKGEAFMKRDEEGSRDEL